MPRAAQVRLDLSSKAGNVPVVRQALGGLADATGLSSADLNDIGIAVTEACNNASVARLRRGRRAARGRAPRGREDHVGHGSRPRRRARRRRFARLRFRPTSTVSWPGSACPRSRGWPNAFAGVSPAAAGPWSRCGSRRSRCRGTGTVGLAQLERPTIGEEELANTIEVGDGATRGGARSPAAPAARGRGAGRFLDRAALRGSTRRLDAAGGHLELGRDRAASRRGWSRSEGCIELAVGPMAAADASRLADAVGPHRSRLSTSVLDLGGGDQRLVVRLER